MAWSRLPAFAAVHLELHRLSFSVQLSVLVHERISTLISPDSPSEQEDRDMLTVRTIPGARFDRVNAGPFDRSLDRSLDRAFDQLVGSFFENRRAAGPVVDASWQGDRYVLSVDLPGVPASAVGVDVAGQTLTISATTDQLSWQRSIRLGGRLDPDKVEASHVDGRLTVRIGTVDEPTARSVAIATTPLPQLASSADQAIEATAQPAEQPDGQSNDTNTAG
jgi:HSP20 family protein